MTAPSVETGGIDWPVCWCELSPGYGHLWDRRHCPASATPKGAAMSTSILTRHGNVKGWRRHQKAGEKPCEACTRAKSEYDARRRNSDAETRSARIRGRAQIRAYQRLAHEFPEKYATYYAEAKEQVAAEVAEVVTPPGNSAAPLAAERSTSPNSPPASEVRDV